MKTACAIVSSLSLTAISAHAGLVDFNYTQSDSTTGVGTIGAFVAGGHTFNALAMPSATVFNPNVGLTPVGFVGAQTLANGISNEANTAVGLLWSGTVTAISTDGFLIDIPLVFVPKQIQAPTDLNDYTWNITWGDSAANGVDTISTALRFAMYYSRDDVIDAVETANTFQRYTQNNLTFTAGQNTFTNSANSVNVLIKDAQDAGNPAGNDAVGRNLSFYWGWRDTGAISQGAILIDDFAVGGLLNADESTLRPVPEPGSATLLLGSAALLGLRRRRYCAS
jgi:hypothetical protein